MPYVKFRATRDREIVSKVLNLAIIPIVLLILEVTI